MAENLETRAMKAVLEIRDMLVDLGAKFTHIIEYKFDYHTLPKGIDYDGIGN